VCDFLDLDLETRFAKGDWLSKVEIEALVSWLRKTKEGLDEVKKVQKSHNVIAIKTPKKLEQARYGVTIEKKVAKAPTIYQRMSDAANHITWLANALHPSE